MKIVAVTNQKGGCGKTTTAINLSAALAAAGKRILLVDLDPQAHASFALLKDSELPGGSTYNLLTENPEKKRAPYACIAHLSPGFDILPSNIELSTIEQELRDREDAAFVLSGILTGLRSTYDYILVDSPPSLGFLTFNALRAADWVLIPIDMSPFTLVGVGKLMGMIDLLEKQMGHFPRVSALATLFDKRTKYSQSIFDEIRTFFNERMLKTVIRHNVALKRAVTEGRPVVDFDPISHGAEDYSLLAGEILHYDQEAAKMDYGVSLPDMQVVTFAVEAPAATAIYVAGEFNHWAINDENQLSRNENGQWVKQLRLLPGTYRYKFFIDGAWTVDERNHEIERNEFGSFDNVIRV
jgi:chromosome partitioning protein